MKKTLSLMTVVLTLGLALSAVDAEAARRLGGGKSTGMQRSTLTDKSAATPAQTPGSPASATSMAKAPAAAPAAAAPAKRSWMGPIAGLAAGLGLAALASHFGFGEALANMMMIGLLVMAVLAAVAFFMRKRASAQRPAVAGVGGMQYAGAEQAPSTHRGYDVQMPASSGGSSIGADLAPQRNIPADFDLAGFSRNAKVQFIRLQASHDAGNLDDIRAFTTPEMFAEIQMDISDRKGAAQQTEVVNVEADVLEVVEEAERYIVSVRFTGMIREDSSSAADAFDETWHLVKPRQGNGGWLLSGIQQA